MPVDPEIHEIAWDAVSAAKGEYAHFMQKEIFEQARSLTDTMRGRVDFERGTVSLPELNLTAERARALQRIVIVACGTSYYSGLVGKFYLEQLARLNVEVDYGSEYRYRDPIIDDKTAVLAITQSGETVDTLAALEEARAKGATLWSIVNAVGSQAMRLSDGYDRHERRTGNRRRLDQSLHRQHRRSTAAGAANRAPARDDQRRGAALSRRGHRPPARSGRAGARSASGSPRTGATPVSATPISCIWGAGSTTRLRSKARSSSRRSATSTPRAIRRAR